MVGWKLVWLLMMGCKKAAAYGILLVLGCRLGRICMGSRSVEISEVEGSSVTNDLI